MATSTFSSLKFELIPIGGQDGSWGSTTNSNIGTAINEAIAGSYTVSFSGADITLTLSDSVGTQPARNMRLVLSGTSGGARNLIFGTNANISKPYVISNELADAVTVKNTTGTGVTVPAGKTMWVYNNGTNVVDAVTHLSSLTLGAALPVASGGTGATTAGTARTNLGATTLGGNLFTVTNPSAVTFPRFNADNTVSALDAATFRTAIGAGTGSGSVTGVTATAPVASSGGTAPDISLSANYGDTLNPYASKTANFVLAAPNGSAGVPSFRAIVAADIPTSRKSWPKRGRK